MTEFGPLETTAIHLSEGRDGGGLQVSGPVGWITSFAGRSQLPDYRPPWLESRSPSAPPSGTPDLPWDVTGIAVVLNTPVGDGRGGRELYEAWAFAGQRRQVPLCLEHRGVIGYCELDPLPTAILMRGNLAREVELPDPAYLSVGLMNIRSRRAGDLVHVVHADIAEVSIVPRAAHSPHTRAWVTSE